MGISLECDVFVENFNISSIGSFGAFLHTPKYFSFYYWPQLASFVHKLYFVIVRREVTFLLARGAKNSINF